MREGGRERSLCNKKGAGWKSRAESSIVMGTSLAAIHPSSSLRGGGGLQWVGVHRSAITLTFQGVSSVDYSNMVCRIVSAPTYAICSSCTTYPTALLGNVILSYLIPRFLKHRYFKAEHT